MARRFHLGRQNPSSGACAGVIFGLLFVGAAFPLLWWNEGRAVKRYKTLKEGEGLVVTIDPLEVDEANEGRLVHMTALATTKETLRDPDFGVEVNAIRLHRTAQMYQWEEHEDTDTHTDANGDSYTTTSYSYHKTWSSNVINSGGFQESGGHENPDSMRYRGREFEASRVTVGNFFLSPTFIKKIDESQTVPLDAATTLPAGFEARDGWLYDSRDRGRDTIGDLRVRFDAVYPQEVSIVAGQYGARLDSYYTQAGGTLELLLAGAHTAEAMFKREHRINTVITWGIRAGGAFAMFLGFLMLGSPLTSMTRWIPGLRTIVGAGMGLFALGLSASLSMLTIGVAWLAYRPTLTWVLAAAAGTIFAVLYIRGRRESRA